MILPTSEDVAAVKANLVVLVSRVLTQCHYIIMYNYQKVLHWINV